MQVYAHLHSDGGILSQSDWLQEQHVYDMLITCQGDIHRQFLSETLTLKQ